MRVVLVSWSPDASDAVERLRTLADRVDVVAPKGPPDLKALAADLPDAFVIDLDRRPSEGLVIGIALRRQAATRRTPQVFAGGEPDKVDRVRSILHDARFTDWDGIGAILRTAIERPPNDPVVPDAMAPYAGVSLDQKLGLTGDARIRLLGAPDGFSNQVEEARRTDGDAELVILFARTRKELERELAAAMDSVAEDGSLWVAWPKGGKGSGGELTQLVVRERCMDAGWVDYKIASLDETWSALRFRKRN